MIHYPCGKPESLAAYPPSFGGQKNTLQTKERRVMTMVTYSDLIQFCILIVTLIGLCYKIFKDK